VLLNHWAQMALITPVMFYTGWPIHRTGWLALSHRSADMNSLIMLGTVAAFGYSLIATLAPGMLPAGARGVYFETTGVILTLILLGRLIEIRAKAGTGQAIRELLGLQARTARVIRHGAEAEVAVEDMVGGDEVVIRPGEKIPVRSDDTPLGSPPIPSPATQTTSAQVAGTASARRLPGLPSSHAPMHSSIPAGSHHQNGWPANRFVSEAGQ